MTKTYLVYKKDHDHVIDTAISHYKTIVGLKRYGHAWLKVKGASIVEVYAFNTSAQLYSGNMPLLGTIELPHID